MTIRIRLAGHVCGLIFFCSLAACAPSTTDKPGATPAPRSDSDTSANDPRAGEGQRGGTKESETGSSSLKQMQEGKSSATPASSPLKDVFYEFDRYDLSADARATLRANADWLKSNPSARVEIEGHCDERGTNEYNLALGAKRAQAAREFLTSLGFRRLAMAKRSQFAESRLKIVGQKIGARVSLSSKVVQPLNWSQGCETLNF